VKKSEWSEEEDRAILEGIAEMGTRWCDIVKVPALVGRTDNAIKNRFYSLQRRMRSRQLAAAKPSSPLGKRQLVEDSNDIATPTQERKFSQRDRIVAVATQLAFATDELERDRLIAELSNALQADNVTADDASPDVGSPSAEHPQEHLQEKPVAASPPEGD